MSSPTVAHGYNFALGIAPEFIYGTAILPSGYLVVENESLQLKQTTIAQPQLGFSSQDRYALSKVSVDGTFEIAATYNNPMFDTMLKFALGSVATTGPNGDGVYTHTYTCSDNLAASGLTVYVDRDATTLGTAYNYTGCQIGKLTLTYDEEKYITAAVDIVGVNEAATTKLTASYPTWIPAQWNEVSTLTVNGVSLPAKMTEITFEAPLADDRYQLGQRTRIGISKKSPRKVTGKITVELEDVTTLNLFRNQTEVAGVFNCTGPAIGASTYQLNVSIPRMVLQGTTPNVKDVGPIMVDFPFEAFATVGNKDEISIVTKNLNAVVL